MAAGCNGFSQVCLDESVAWARERRVSAEAARQNWLSAHSENRTDVRNHAWGAVERLLVNENLPAF